MTISAQEQKIIRKLLVPLEPVATGVEEVIFSLSVKAVIFDIYGTLLISAAGDVGPDSAEDDESAFSLALADGGWGSVPSAVIGTRLLREEIDNIHADKKETGMIYPEIDIILVWKRVLTRLGFMVVDEEVNRIRLTALSYECRINPVWPMPGLMETITSFKNSGIIMGVLSNAQFYTPVLFEFLSRSSFADLGFNNELLLFSYKEGRGKPSLKLFKKLDERLNIMGIKSEQVLFVGNDMLKDIRPALAVGWKTALFGGDQRSLRWHRDKPGSDVVPDLVITDLVHLKDVLKSAVSEPAQITVTNQPDKNKDKSISFCPTLMGKKENGHDQGHGGNHSGDKYRQVAKKLL